MGGSSQLNLKNSLRMEVARTPEQLAHAFAIRSICFMEDEGYRVKHAFDGNDYVGTHIIVYDGDEPIGATRLRWFKDFAKIERTAFRKAHRSARILRDCSDFIFGHVAMKGYDRLVTLAEEHYARVWIRVLGFTKVDDEPVSRPGEEARFYLLEKRLVVPEHAITADTPIRVMIRTEGAWDVPLSFG